MMNGIMYVNYYKDQELGFEIISIPYKGNRFVLLIIKSADIGDNDSKQKRYKALSKNGYQPIFDKMKNTTVEVTLPKMKIDITDSENIIENLKSIGLKKVFDESTYFSGLSPKSGLVVSRILQKILIEISESGSVGVTATAKGLKPPANVKFALDSRSRLVLRDQKYGLDLFAARVCKPQPLK
ncbi:UNVERIFIED_CONTAM: hypothetical protein RMT77_019724 [Armadillidium vulgare]